MKNALCVIVAVSISFLSNAAFSATGTLAPINLASASGKTPITDSNTGLVSYIVDLKDHLQDSFPATVTSQDLERFSSRHSPQAINMVKSYEQQYGFQHTDMTSWVGNSFTAY